MSKELNEVIEAVMKLSVICVEQFKDGVQLSDAIAILMKLQSNDSFRNSLVEAYEGANKIPNELENISIQDTMEIVQTIVGFVPEILLALKKNVS